MIDVKNKSCSCGKQPYFNVPEETKGVCCAKCKTDEMINVVTKICPCGKRPYFNIHGETRGFCCAKCKTDEMINVVNNRCPCGKKPHFNIPGETKPIYCKDCKTDNMINVDHKSCLCGKTPHFNIPGETRGICCAKCKAANMINVMSSICPGYNTECPVRTYIGNDHKYCMSCDPNDARRKRFKRYEEAFFNYVKDKINNHQRNFTVSFDPNETSKKRAFLDGVVFGDGVIVCLEIDENGHENYECDEHRMHLVTAELLQKYPDHVVSWVRVNPTTDEKSQTSKKSQKIQEKRFEEVAMVVNDILEMKKTVIVYIGFP
jgi:hypothetical protein